MVVLRFLNTTINQNSLKKIKKMKTMKTIHNFIIFIIYFSLAFMIGVLYYPCMQTYGNFWAILINIFLQILLYSSKEGVIKLSKYVTDFFIKIPETEKNVYTENELDVICTIYMEIPKEKFKKCLDEYKRDTGGGDE